MFDLFTVKLWGKGLICDICSGDKWHKSAVKIEIENEEITGEYEEQVRYMFECSNCGNCRLFGMVAKYNEIEESHEVNLHTKKISNVE